MPKQCTAFSSIKPQNHPLDSTKTLFFFAAQRKSPAGAGPSHGACQAHGVSERLKFARSMMRRSTGLDANEARRQLLKEGQHVPALQLTTKDHLTIRVNAMNLKDRLRDIETDSRNRLHDLAPPNHPVP